MVGASDVDILDAAVLEPVRVGAATTARNLPDQAARIANLRILSGLIANSGVLGAASGFNAHVAHGDNTAIGVSDHAAGTHIFQLFFRLPRSLSGDEHIDLGDDRRARCGGYRGANIGVHRYVAGGITEHTARTAF